MLKRLMVLGGMLVMLLVVAAPAFAQAETEKANIAGEIQPVANPTAEGPTHIVIEDVTGDEYGLFSDAQGVDLSQYEGQFGYVTGIFQTQGAPLSDFKDPTEVPIYVTAVEVPEGGPYETEYAEISGVITPNPEGNVPGGEVPSHLITEDGTGDVYVLHSGEVDLRLYEGMHVTVYGPFQTMGGPVPPDATRVPIWVTSLEVLDEATPSDEPDAVITSVIQPTANPEKEGSTHTITEDATGDVYGLFSNLQDDGVDLSQYIGQRVTITGYFQTQGGPISDFPDPTEVLIYVESVEVLGSAPIADDQYQDESTAVDDSAPDGGAAEEVASADTASENGVLSVLPDTGGFSLVVLRLVALLLLGGGGLLAYGLTRR